MPGYLHIQDFLDRIEFPDAYRAFFYLEAIESGLARLLSSRNPHTVEIEALLPFFNSLVDDADRSIAPVFAYEITLAKQKTSLQGSTTQSRYRSFFLDSEGWAPHLRAVRTKYGFLFNAVSDALVYSINNPIECLTRFHADWTRLKQFLLTEESSARIKKITLLSSDRHRMGRQPILLELQSGSKIIYKPTDLVSDVLFGSFIDLLKLPKPFDLRYARVMARVGYGWIEFIPHESCSEYYEIDDYYRRTGVLLAIADYLNYTDGHTENLIAFGQYPVLVDTETLFQPGSANRENRSPLFTMLVQKIPDDLDGFRFSAAIQAPSNNRVHMVFPYVQNDQTDEMKILFHGVPAPNT